MHSAHYSAQSLLENRAYLLNIKGVSSDSGSFAATDGQTTDHCVTETMAILRQSYQVVLVRNRLTPIALKMT